MKKNGFTLIEILIVIGIFGILAFIGTNMFFTILKSSAKTRVLAEVKQNGNYAISVMERMVRNARSAECISGGVLITNPDRDTTNFFCEGTKIASKSGVYLTSDKVAATGCNFSCAGTTPEVVTISFTLSQSGTTTRPEEEATIDFRTTVSLRTY